MKHLSLNLLCLGILPLLVSAEWQLVKDFNDGSFDGINTLDTNHSENFDTTGIIDLVPRPFDDQGGRSLATSAGFGLFNDFHVWIDIPAIADGSDGTVYFEFAQSDQANNTAFGTTNVQEIQDPTWRWPIYSALARSNFGSFDVFDQEDLGRTPGYDNVVTLSVSTWYRMWFHVDNFNDKLSVWVQGGEWEEQTLVYSEALFRNFISVDDQIKFLIIQAAGNQNNPSSGQYVYWDNLFVDTTGLNLSDPEVGEPPVIEENPFADLINGLKLDAWASVETYGDFYGFQNGSGWAYNFSLGFVNTDEYPWLYSSEIGFFSFIEGDYKSEDGIYLFAPEHGWLNVGVGYWSSLWLFDDGDWVDLNN